MLILQILSALLETITIHTWAPIDLPKIAKWRSPNSISKSDFLGRQKKLTNWEGLRVLDSGNHTTKWHRIPGDAYRAFRWKGDFRYCKLEALRQRQPDGNWWKPFSDENHVTFGVLLYRVLVCWCLRIKKRHCLTRDWIWTSRGSETIQQFPAQKTEKEIVVFVRHTLVEQVNIKEKFAETVPSVLK